MVEFSSLTNECKESLIKNVAYNSTTQKQKTKRKTLAIKNNNNQNHQNTINNANNNSKENNARYKREILTMTTETRKTNEQKNKIKYKTINPTIKLNVNFLIFKYKTTINKKNKTKLYVILQFI